MDVIESSHFETVKQWLQDHPRYELKVRSYVSNTNRFWEFKIQPSGVYIAPSPIEYCEVAMSFGSALKLISKRLSLTPGDTNEHSSSNS